MDPKRDLQEMHKKILLMKREAEGLQQMAGEFPALYRNADRILASIKMLEINLSDLLVLGVEPEGA